MSYGFASDIGSSRRRLADFFGWKIGSLRSARVTGPRRYYEPVRPCAARRYSAFSGAAAFRVSLCIAAQVPTFRTRACHRDRAASIPVAARPVGRLPPGLLPKEGAPLVSTTSGMAFDTSSAVHSRSPSRYTPDGFPPAFSINTHHPSRYSGAACGGLDPDPAIRARGAYPHLLCSKAAQK